MVLEFEIKWSIKQLVSSILTDEVNSSPWNWSWTAGCQAWPARLLTMLQILLATLGAAAVQTKDEGYPVLSAALLASIVLGLHMSVEALENVESFCTNHSLTQHTENSPS